MNGDTCERCRWFQEFPLGKPVDINGNKIGMCKRRSPILENNSAHWPFIASDNWCGDFQSAPNVQNLPGVAPMPAITDWSVNPTADGTQTQERP